MIGSRPLAHPMPINLTLIKTNGTRCLVSLNGSASRMNGPTIKTIRTALPLKQSSSPNKRPLLVPVNNSSLPCLYPRCLLRLLLLSKLLALLLFLLWWNIRIPMNAHPPSPFLLHPFSLFGLTSLPFLSSLRLRGRITSHCPNNLNRGSTNNRRNRGSNHNKNLSNRGSMMSIRPTNSHLSRSNRKNIDTREHHPSQGKFLLPDLLDSPLNRSFAPEAKWLPEEAIASTNNEAPA